MVAQEWGKGLGERHTHGLLAGRSNGEGEVRVARAEAVPLRVAGLYPEAGALPGAAFLETGALEDAAVQVHLLRGPAGAQSTKYMRCEHSCCGTLKAIMLLRCSRERTFPVEAKWGSQGDYSP